MRDPEMTCPFYSLAVQTVGRYIVDFGKRQRHQYPFRARFAWRGEWGSGGGGRGVSRSSGG